MPFDLSKQNLLRLSSKEPLSAYEAQGIAALPLNKDLLQAVGDIRDRATANRITYSPKVFIPITHLCRDVCHYCTFATTPSRVKSPYMSEAEILSVATKGAALGCKEALLTLGEKPELRYKVAAKALNEMGMASTLEYVAKMAQRIIDETGLLPHINAGNMTEAELAMLRPVSASMGIMLESSSKRLCAKGMPHYGSPDKHPALRLRTIALAGRKRVPFSTGILIGIGETRLERLTSLLELRRLHSRYGHLQEILIQNFRAKANTKMASFPELPASELLWTVAIARLLFPITTAVQVPPNLNPTLLSQLIDAGINDWGGISPLTPDFVNPEAPWPSIKHLHEASAQSGYELCPRLCVYPHWISEQWLDKNIHQNVRLASEADGLLRREDWRAGTSTTVPKDVVATSMLLPMPNRVSEQVRQACFMASQAKLQSESLIANLFSARGADFSYLCRAADNLRREHVGNRVGFVVNRNINYTNICTYHCHFCSFSKGSVRSTPRDAPYRLPLTEIADRARQAWQRGATEVCLQGGIHPKFNGSDYIKICRAVREAVPDIHIHAFSPLEIFHGASTLGISEEEFLTELKQQGLNSLPGTAAEILDDEVRAIICADKINTEQWLNIIRTAHLVGLPTTSTIMFGHVDKPIHWARHLLRLRRLQQETGGITEFVPLPFVAEYTPLYLRNACRPGPSFREAVLMHTIARLVLHPIIPNIQTSWVKLGSLGARACLNAGANDMGGTLMNESITRAAGATHGQEMTATALSQLIRRQGRLSWQRTTQYYSASLERRRQSTHIASTVTT